MKMLLIKSELNIYIYIYKNVIIVFKEGIKKIIKLIFRF